jgi:hypothetical protein
LFGFKRAKPVRPSTATDYNRLRPFEITPEDMKQPSFFDRLAASWRAGHPPKAEPPKPKRGRSEWADMLLPTDKPGVKKPKPESYLMEGDLPADTDLRPPATVQPARPALMPPEPPAPKPQPVAPELKEPLLDVKAEAPAPKPAAPAPKPPPAPKPVPETPKGEVRPVSTLKQNLLTMSHNA